MTRDPELQELVDEAAARRARAERAAATAPAPAPAPAKPPSPIRLGVYRRMHDGAPGLLWWLPIGALLGMAFVVDAAWFRYTLLAFGVAFAVRIVIYAIGLVRGYAEFQRFPASLAFPMDGWLPLLVEEITTNAERWRGQVTFAVTLAPGADREVVEAALELCAVRANGAFYTGESFSGSSGDVREKWKREGTTIKGSANIWVIGNLYRCARALDWIHRKTPSVTRIAITTHGGIYGVSRPSAE